MNRLFISICVMFASANLPAKADGYMDRIDGQELRPVAKSPKLSQPPKAQKVKMVAKVAKKTKSTKVRPGAKYSARRAKLVSVVKSTKPANLPFGLVDAVIAKESRYKINAKGASGEIGLMQIMPSTARRIAKSLGQHKVAKMSGADLRRHLTDARTNIRYGTTYLAKCHKMAKGNIGATIGCYNAGPGNMWRWSKIDITNKYVHFVRRHMAGKS